jgi:uncharacterized membrane protein YedE/YeeE
VIGSIRSLAPFLVGLVFAVGIAVAGMTPPDKVVGFLDVTGDWDPSLALVMAGAIAVYAAAFRFSRRLPRPLLAVEFPRIARTRIDRRLVIGSLLFGAGWGLAGYCPGPALASLGPGASPQIFMFVAAMLGGMWITRAVERLRAYRAPAAAVTRPS